MKNVKKFVEQQRQLLGQFKCMWEDVRVNDPDSEAYPEEMNDADWQEQYELFLEENQEVKESFDDMIQTEEGLTFEEYKTKVVDTVRAAIKDCDWYRGVCTNSIQDSFDNKLSVEDAASAVESETRYHDGPWLGSWFTGVR